MVDCERFATKKGLLSLGNGGIIDEDIYREVDGKKYYYAESNGILTERMTLISDISGLMFDE